MKSILNQLEAYSQSDYYGFHMPGHKRQKWQENSRIPYEIDITEIEGFDDLHHPEGILLDAENRAAKIFHSTKSFYLINGSTAGNLASIFAATTKGGKVIVARNSHKSIYNAIFLRELNPVYVYPEFDLKQRINGGIKASQISELLEKEQDVEAIILTSPTYEGVVSEIQEIVRIAHKNKVKVIVDEAHGAHFGFHEYFPKSANFYGADCVIQSVHKTLPSLTQTGLLHVNGSAINQERLQRYLQTFQSSSPSYILMASIDCCVDFLEHSEKKFQEYVTHLSKLRNRLKQLKTLILVETKEYDFSKIVISTRHSDVTSKELYTLLWKDYHLQFEMVGADYVVAMTTVMDTEEGFERLESALFQIDHSLKFKAEIEPWDFKQLEVKKQTQDAIVSDKFYYLYPPGIPMVVPGEPITDELLEMMKEYEKRGFKIRKS